MLLQLLAAVGMCKAVLHGHDYPVQGQHSGVVFDRLAQSVAGTGLRSVLLNVPRCCKSSVDDTVFESVAESRPVAWPLCIGSTTWAQYICGVVRPQPSAGHGWLVPMEDGLCRDSSYWQAMTAYLRGHATFGDGHRHGTVYVPAWSWRASLIAQSYHPSIAASDAVLERLYTYARLSSMVIHSEDLQAVLRPYSDARWDGVPQRCAGALLKFAVLSSGLSIDQTPRMMDDLPDDSQKSTVQLLGELNDELVCLEELWREADQSVGQGSVDDVHALRALARRLYSSLSCKYYNVDAHGGFCLTKDRPDVGGNGCLAEDMATTIYDFFTGSTVIDFGAGQGQYVGHWRRLQAAGRPGGPISARPYDGAANIEEATDGRVAYADLAERMELPVADWVMTLEVAEHLPAEYEAAFLDNVHRHNRKGIVMSWARPGQGGHFHFNEQPASYVIPKIEAMGYRYDEATSLRLRVLADDDTFWFRDTVYVFHRVRG